MKPETYKLWEEALRRFGRAKELLKDEKFEEAKGEAILAVLFGVRAIILEPSKELEMHDLPVIANNALQDLFEKSRPEKHYTLKEILEWTHRALTCNALQDLPEWSGKHYTPKENIEWAQKTLKELSDELPDTFPPFRY